MKRPKSIRLAALLTVFGAACADPGSELDRVAERLAATPYGTPFAMPDAELTATDGSGYDLRTETAGRLTLLFFGYTYCPDICPITMAVSNAAIAKLPPDERERIVSLFVSMDPMRDTRERIREWLDAMDSRAVGLRGSMSEVESVLNGIGMVMPPTTDRQPVAGATQDDYLVPHPAWLFVITPDGVGRFIYVAERVTPEQMAADFRSLLALDWTAAPQAGGAAATVSVDRVRIPAPPGRARVAVYARVRGGDVADTLTGLTSPSASEGSLHEMVMERGMMTMSPIDAIEVPAGADVELAPGRLHGMLEGLDGVPTVGDTISVTFEFASGRRVTVDVPVVDPAEAATG